MNIAPSQADVALLIRTLLAAGFSIGAVQRSPRYIEIPCERSESLGALCRYLIAATDEDTISSVEVDSLEYRAREDGRSLVLIARRSDGRQLSWRDAMDALGGAVPEWRALADSYPVWLRTAGTNAVPTGYSGEAWRLFEDLVADGLGFLFGRRVLQLGARKRGRAVSDMVVEIPTSGILVVDAKASEKGFDASKDELRALIEYVRHQTDRQRGHMAVVGALIASSGFRQNDDSLAAISRWVWSECRVPAAFIDTAVLGYLVERLKQNPHIRTALRWSHLFAGCRVTRRLVDDELSAASTERYPGSAV